jgi:phosphoribosyl 1,2-cyclic phosphate phosphodiesterase
MAYVDRAVDGRCKFCPLHIVPFANRHFRGEGVSFRALSMANLVFTFLGTGTSQGVPMIGCDCAVCSSTDPRDKRTRASVYLETPGGAFVVDTGPDFRQQALRERIRRVDAVVLTHPHTDHIMGFDDLRAFCHGGRELPVYGSPETLAVLRRVFAFAFDGENRYPGYIHPVAHEISGPLRLGDMELIPMLVPHGRVKTTAFLFVRGGRKLVAYFPDCKEVPLEARKCIAGVEVLILDALRRKEHPTHMNVEEALAVAHDINPRETWFTHLCHDLAHAELEAELPSRVRVAYDGLRLVL